MALSDTTVKHMRSTQRGAPTLLTKADLLTALRAFLVTGWGSVVTNTVTVTGGVAEADLTLPNAFDKYSVVRVSGATEGVMNEDARLTYVNGNKVRWQCSGSDGAKAGTITLKCAPLGWEEVFTETDVAVFRSTDAQSNRRFLRVDCSGTYPRVVAYEAMTGPAAGTGVFPTSGQMAGGGYWYLPGSAGAYTFVGDSRFFIYAPRLANARSVPWGFGDLAPLTSAGDPFGTVLSYSSITAGTDQAENLLQNSGLAMPRSASGSGTSVLCNSYPWGSADRSILSGSSAGVHGAITDTPGSRLILSHRFVREGIDLAKGPRGVIPGILHSHQRDLPALFPDGSTLIDDDRVLLALETSNFNSATFGSMYFIDITGPW